MAEAHLTPIEVGLTAAIVAVEAEEPRILVAADPKGGTRAGLPFGPFDPLRTAPSRSACATGWRRRPRSTSAMSSSSTPSATAAATRGRTTPACT